MIGRFLRWIGRKLLVSRGNDLLSEMVEKYGLDGVRALLFEKGWNPTRRGDRHVWRHPEFPKVEVELPLPDDDRERWIDEPGPADWRKLRDRDRADNVPPGGGLD